MSRRNRSSRKPPSAAERARREAQSATDAGTIHADLWGVDVTITHEALTDLEYLVDMSVIEDEATTETDRGRACLRVMRHLCGESLRPVLAAFTQAEGHRPRGEDLRRIIERLFEAVPES